MASNPLIQLNDIQLPEPVTWWPLAWGWWVLIVFVLLSVIVAIYMAIHFWQQRKAKKIALRHLSALQEEPIPMKVVIGINNILKRVLLAYLPREQVANLTGSEWVALLNRMAPNHAHLEAKFVQLAYRPKCSAKAADEYLNQALAWVKASLPISKRTKSLLLQKECN